MNTVSSNDSNKNVSKEVTDSFVKKEDYDIFSQNGRDLNACISLFLVEMREYVNKHWSDEFHIKEPLESLEQFNRDHLLGYPSTGGYHVLEDTFTGPDCQIKIFSPGSLQILSYFYGMNFHN